MLKGNDIIILLDGTAIAACKSHRVASSCSTEEKASATQQKYREFLPGRTEWGVSVNKLITAVADIDMVLLSGTVVTLVIQNRTGTKTLTGQAIVTACETTYTKGNLATGSYSFKGTGPLTAST